MRLLLVVGVIVLCVGSVLAQSRIYFIRHAKVDIRANVWCTANEVEDYRDRYNFNNVIPFNPCEVRKKLEAIFPIDTVLCSPLFRSQATAAVIFGNNVVYEVNEPLRELDYRLLHIPLIKLPRSFWTVSSRLGTMLFSRAQYQQTSIWVDELERRAKNRDIVIVGHGFQMRQTINILRKRGWQRAIKEPFKNLSVNCMVK